MIATERGMDLHMERASTTENLRMSGSTEGLAECQIKNLVVSSLAAMMNISFEDMTAHLKNKEQVTTAPPAEDKTDAETKEYLQRADDVNKAVEEQEKADAECRRPRA